MTNRAQAPQDFIGSYGSTWRAGVISEHVPAFVAAGGQVRPAASGSGLSWAVMTDANGWALPVVCSALVAVYTEDGAQTGRCGADATVDGSCPGHAEEAASWLAASEAERVRWEKDADAWAVQVAPGLWV
jgi:hypothetical protein